VHVDHVRVVDPGHRSRLAPQSILGLVQCPGFATVQQLDGDLAVELGVVAEIDLAHPARAQFASHLVASEGLEDRLDGIQLVLAEHALEYVDMQRMPLEGVVLEQTPARFPGRWVARGHR